MQSQRTTPLRNPHTSTSDLLTWSEQPPPESSASGYRSRQPSDKIGEVLRGSKLTAEEAQSLTKKKPCSGYKLKEMTGSGIFSGNSEDTTSEENSANSKNRTSIRVYKQAMNGISQISFSTEGNISPKKPTSLPEIAKQRELGGTYQSETVTKINKQTSSAKTKELSGSDIFAPPSEIVPRSLAAAHTLESKESKDTRISVPQKVSTSAQVSNRADGQSNFSFSEQPVKILRKKMHDQKFTEMTGNNIFKGDVPAGSPEKPSSRAKLREMAGSDIFADGKAESRDHILGARRPPGGGSDIFADGKAESRDHILGARRPPGGGSDIFADGKVESSDHILGALRNPGGGSYIFADGKAESRDHVLGARRPLGGGSDIFADGKAESRDHILGARRPPGGGSDIFADGKAESRDHILGARRPPGGGSDIFADGTAESRDHILGARRPPGGGSDIFADGKAESRDHILGAHRPPGGGSDIFADGKAESRDHILLGARRSPGGGSSIALV